MNDLLEKILGHSYDELYALFVAPILLFVFAGVRNCFKRFFGWIRDCLRQVQGKIRKAIIRWLWPDLDPEIMCLIQPIIDDIRNGQEHTLTLLEGKIEDDKVESAQIKEMLTTLITKTDNRRSTDTQA